MIARVKTTIFQRDVIRYGSFILLILLAGVLLLMSGVARYPEMLGMAYLSFTFGLRHAFDVQHPRFARKIAPIDISRRLECSKFRPVSFPI